MFENSKKPKNIFEAASHIEKARTQKKGPLHPPESEQITIVTDIVHKGRKLHEEIAAQVDSLFSRGKISPSDYRQYLSKEQNFSVQDWQKLDEQKKKNEELLRELAKQIGAKAPPSSLLEEKAPSSVPKVKAPPPPKEAAPLKQKAVPPQQPEEGAPAKPEELAPPPPTAGGPPEKKPPQKKPKIVTKRHWIGM